MVSHKYQKEELVISSQLSVVRKSEKTENRQLETKLRRVNDEEADCFVFPAFSF